MTGAEYVRAVRRDLGMTQKQFAAALGCSQVTVARWETDARKVSEAYRNMIWSVFTRLKGQCPACGQELR